MILRVIRGWPGRKRHGQSSGTGTAFLRLERRGWVRGFALADVLWLREHLLLRRRYSKWADSPAWGFTARLHSGHISLRRFAGASDVVLVGISKLCPTLPTLGRVVEDALEVTRFFSA